MVTACGERKHACITDVKRENDVASHATKKVNQKQVYMTKLGGFYSHWSQGIRNRKHLLTLRYNPYMETLLFMILIP